MTDMTPVPTSVPGPAVFSMQQVRDLEAMVRENKAAQLRGDPLPHQITPEMLRDALNSIRQQRGTLNFASDAAAAKAATGGSKAKKAASIIEIDLDDL